MATYRIDYECPTCEHEWQERWSCACNSECPACGQPDIEPAEYEEA